MTQPRAITVLVRRRAAAHVYNLLGRMLDGSELAPYERRAYQAVQEAIRRALFPKLYRARRR